MNLPPLAAGSALRCAASTERMVRPWQDSRDMVFKMLRGKMYDHHSHLKSKTKERVAVVDETPHTDEAYPVPSDKMALRRTGSTDKMALIRQRSTDKMACDKMAFDKMARGDASSTRMALIRESVIGNDCTV